MSIGRLKNLLEIATVLSDVEEVNMYSKDAIYINGTTKDGRKLNLSLTVKEEEKDDTL